MKDLLQARKDQAMAVLIDEITEIKDDLNKACLLLQDLQTGYFEKYDCSIAEEREYIAYDFPANKTYAKIIGDYVFQAKQRIEVLESRGDEIVRSEAV